MYSEGYRNIASKILQFSLGNIYIGYHDPIKELYFITDDKGFIEKFAFSFRMFRSKNIPTESRDIEK